ncbi:MAG: hypothetical protein A2Z38_02845 [Planctomycetes bacterium RBG_19FT_COMBO_48_8]|nr:MAG: hypothetical protein A2Z38_02845 [Planctomycetes bacterium RBG_19FT_COMBO_48_8]
MRSRSNYPIQVLAAGFLVLVFLSLLLFWASWLCKSILADIMPMNYRTVEITPSGLVPAEIESDPNVVRHSGVHAHIMSPEAPQALGIANYLSDKAPEGRHSKIYYLNLEGENSACIYFDARTGQINCCWADVEKMPDGTSMRKNVQFYAGPEGVSEIPDKKLGRFTPVVADFYSTPLILYDSILRRFFAINLKDRNVTKGPQLPKDDPHRPVDIGKLNKNPGVLDLCWSQPDIKTSQNHKDGVFYSRLSHVLVREGNSDYDSDRYVLVLDESGRIDLLDKETLEFAGPAGRLPAPETFFPADKNVTPDDLLAYRVLPIALKEDHKYRGLIAAAVSREGTALALAVFDANGVPIKSDQTWTTVRRGNIITYSSSAVFFGAPWAPVMTIGKFLLENLHPPILSLASYFTAGSIEAASGHRAMFLLPNSFIAMKGRDARANIAARFLYALALISPSIVLAILLAWRVGKDAAGVGLPQNTRRFWTLGTLAFGLTGYITYKLTRPKVTLITCANCGKPRRTDMDKCHRCGSKWDVPELIPPAWRVLDK